MLQPWFQAREHWEKRLGHDHVSRQEHNLIKGNGSYRDEHDMQELHGQIVVLGFIVRCRSPGCLSWAC